MKMVVEVSEIKSYKLSDDGNMVTIMMKDGTVHNNLIFLDEGLAVISNCLEVRRNCLQVRQIFWNVWRAMQVLRNPPLTRRCSC